MILLPTFEYDKNIYIFANKVPINGRSLAYKLISWYHHCRLLGHNSWWCLVIFLCLVLKGAFIIYGSCECIWVTLSVCGASSSSCPEYRNLSTESNIKSQFLSISHRWCEWCLDWVCKLSFCFVIGRSHCKYLLNCII